MLMAHPAVPRNLVQQYETPQALNARLTAGADGQ
ncbi:DUF5133 domain-containing protein [Streptomyces sp. NBS 14/10]|nr:DUF5133 domain-containing protein [Streptomyces sp. NBS 14/10]KAK1182289.1 DUF5133 domain-containing protein [Streptomyces sp. NBS 14/10]